MSNCNFTFAELVASQTAKKRGIDNMPKNMEIISNLVTLWRFALQPLRDAMKFPIIITSGYRCTALNKAVGGVENSYHLQGLAADIDCGDVRNKKIYEWLKSRQKYYKLKEVLWENNGSWVHVAIEK